MPDDPKRATSVVLRLKRAIGHMRRLLHLLTGRMRSGEVVNPVGARAAPQIEPWGPTARFANATCTVLPKCEGGLATSTRCRSRR